MLAILQPTTLTNPTGDDDAPAVLTYKDPNSNPQITPARLVDVVAFFLLGASAGNYASSPVNVSAVVIHTYMPPGWLLTCSFLFPLRFSTSRSLGFRDIHVPVVSFLLLLLSPLFLASRSLSPVRFALRPPRFPRQRRPANVLARSGPRRGQSPSNITPPTVHLLGEKKYPLSSSPTTTTTITTTTTTTTTTPPHS